MPLPALFAPRLSAIAAAAMLLALALGGCSSIPGYAPGPPAKSFAESTCVRAPLIASLRAERSMPVPDHASLPALPPAFPFSGAAINTARAIGALPELIAIAKAKESGLSPQQSLIARQTLLARITLTMLDVASVTGQLDCEDERSGQLRDQLQKTEEQRLRSLTISGLVLGAATAIFSGGIALANPDAPAAAAVSVLGGGAQAAAGFAALNVSQTGSLMHERNLLSDLWEEKDDSQLYPIAVWRFLTQEREPTSEVPLRRVLIEQWKAGERLGKSGSEEERRRVALIFGKGGEYSVEDLRARDAILDQLEAMVKLLYQDLGLLLRELSVWTAVNQG